MRKPTSENAVLLCAVVFIAGITAGLVLQAVFP